MAASVWCQVYHFQGSIYLLVYSSRQIPQYFMTKLYCLTFLWQRSALSICLMLKAGQKMNYQMTGHCCIKIRPLTFNIPLWTKIDTIRTDLAGNRTSPNSVIYSKPGEAQWICIQSESKWFLMLLKKILVPQSLLIMLSIAWTSYPCDSMWKLVEICNKMKDYLFTFTAPKINATHWNQHLPFFSLSSFFFFCNTEVHQYLLFSCSQGLTKETAFYRTVIPRQTWTHSYKFLKL